MNVKVITKENEHLCSYDIKEAKDSTRYAELKDAFLTEIGMFGEVQELIPNSTISITKYGTFLEENFLKFIKWFKAQYHCDIDVVIK